MIEWTYDAAAVRYLGRFNGRACFQIECFSGEIGHMVFRLPGAMCIGRTHDTTEAMAIAENDISGLERLAAVSS